MPLSFDGGFFMRSNGPSLTGAAAGISSEDMADESDRSVFIVRIWREPRESEIAPPECRGVVEHVASGQRRFFRELGDLDEFIQRLSCIEQERTSRR